MPAIKEINFADGIRIVGDGIPSFEIKRDQFPSVTLPSQLEAKLNTLIQEQYEGRTLLSTFPADDPVRQSPPILCPNERIEKITGKDYLITTLMYVQVHVYSLSPLKYNICCSDMPITGEWW